MSIWGRTGCLPNKAGPLMDKADEQSTCRPGWELSSCVDGTAKEPQLDGMYHLLGNIRSHTTICTVPKSCQLGSLGGKTATKVPVCYDFWQMGSWNSSPHDVPFAPESAALCPSIKAKAGRERSFQKLPLTGDRIRPVSSFVECIYSGQCPILAMITTCTPYCTRIIV